MTVHDLWSELGELIHPRILRHYPLIPQELLIIDFNLIYGVVVQIDVEAVLMLRLGQVVVDDQGWLRTLVVHETFELVVARPYLIIKQHISSLLLTSQILIGRLVHLFVAFVTCYVLRSILFLVVAVLV